MWGGLQSAAGLQPRIFPGSSAVLQRSSKNPTDSPLQSWRVLPRRAHQLYSEGDKLGVRASAEQNIASMRGCAAQGLEDRR
jgi:hypothetical protein